MQECWRLMSICMKPVYFILYMPIHSPILGRHSDQTVNVNHPDMSATRN